MDLRQLKAFIEHAKSTESPRLEFKESTASLDKAIQTLCAFLNAEGGTVLIGVRDNGQIIGQHVSDMTEKDVSRKLLKIEPKTYEIQVDSVDIGQNKKVIVLKAPEGQHKPYVCEGRPHCRDGKETKQMPKDLYDRMVLTHNAAKISWEDQPAQGNYTIEDLDQDLIYKLIRRGIHAGRLSEELEGEPLSKLLERFDLFTGDHLLKQAAIILFAKKTFPFYPQCGITLARFLGNDKMASMLDNKHFYGNVFAMIEEAENFIARNTAISSHFPPGQMQREDRPQVPVYAMREALVNAVSHVDYSQRDCYLMLHIFNNRLELWNAGTLIAPLTIDNLKISHKSRRRNRHIAEMLYKFDYFEGNATGIKKILGECQQWGYPEPSYKEDTGGIDVVFYFPSMEQLAAFSRHAEALPLLELTSRQQAILNLLKKGPYRTAEIAERLLDPPPKRTLQVELRKLEDAHYIQRVGVGRTTAWRAL